LKLRPVFGTSTANRIEQWKAVAPLLPGQGTVVHFERVRMAVDRDKLA
jgi:hypothetical protein